MVLPVAGSRHLAADIDADAGAVASAEGAEVGDGVGRDGERRTGREGEDA